MYTWTVETNSGDLTESPRLTIVKISACNIIVIITLPPRLLSLPCCCWVLFVVFVVVFLLCFCCFGKSGNLKSSCPSVQMLSTKPLNVSKRTVTCGGASSAGVSREKIGSRSRSQWGFSLYYHPNFWTQIGMTRHRRLDFCAKVRLLSSRPRL